MDLLEDYENLKVLHVCSGEEQGRDTGQSTSGRPTMQTCLILLPGVTPRGLAEAPLLASFSDETREGRRIVRDGVIATRTVGAMRE
jgi:hypothetical protein